MADGIKKWFMLQVWRIQQVAQIITIALLALNLSLQLYNYVEWREGIFASAYTGVLLLLLILAAIIWLFSLVWDLRMKMWREQMTVVTEKNPYAKEKMNVKEIMLYGMIWLPMLEKMGKDDPQMLARAEALRRWIKRASKEDAATLYDLNEVFKYLEGKPEELIEFDKKK